MSNYSYQQTARQVYYDIFERISAKYAEIASVWMETLIHEWTQGNAYIELNKEDINKAQVAAPLIGTPYQVAPLILTGNKLFIGQIYQMEKTVAQLMLNLAQQQQQHADLSLIKEQLDAVFFDSANLEQKQAVALSLLNHFTVITGGPGTGKTTTVAKLLAIKCLTSTKQPRIALLAPTGKAATHLQNSLKRSLESLSVIPDEIRQYLGELEGQTLHRLLKIRPLLNTASYHQSNYLPYDILIVDEASMIDLSLMHKLLLAINPDAHLILLGDANQLSSVGGGAVLAQICQATVIDPAENQILSKLLPEHQIEVAQQKTALASSIAFLQTSHRFDENSGIGKLSQAVLAEEDNITQLFQQYPQQLDIKKATLATADNWYKIQENYWQAIDNNNLDDAFNYFFDGMILTTLNEDTERFNQEYLAFLQNKRQLKHFFPGLPLMITENDYNNNLFNGDIGIVFADKNNNLKVYFQTATPPRAINISQLPQYSLAFALTVHKSQGSEYKHVWLIAPESKTDHYPQVWNKTLLYTAITRAKEQFSYFGDPKAIVVAIKNKEQRKSLLLAHLLKEHN